MELKKLVNYITTIATSNLVRVYNYEQAYLAIDDIIYSFLEDDKLFYNLKISFETSEKNGTCLVPALVGLPEDLSKFSEQDAFALAIFLTNLVIEMTTDSCEDYEEDNNSTEENSKYYC
jgi:hypothetical protein